jgi:hypothetical protein
MTKVEQSSRDAIDSLGVQAADEKPRRCDGVSSVRPESIRMNDPSRVRIRKCESTSAVNNAAQLA